MQVTRTVTCVDGHTCGEPVRLVVGGLPRIPGQTVAEKRAHFMEHFDFLRHFLLFEPRGHVGMFAAALVEPCTPEADLGVIFMDTSRYPRGCGHGSIGVAAMAVELGIVPKHDPVTLVRIDTPSGLVSARVEVKNGHVEAVTIRNVPSFVYTLDHIVAVPGYGALTVDIAYGGLFHVLVSARQVPGLRISLEQLDEILELGRAVKDAVINSDLKIAHPINDDDELVDTILFYDDSPGQRHHARVIVCGGVGFDRSPCGTGTSARLALLHRRGEFSIGDVLTHESIVGTTFQGMIVGETTVADYPCVIPEIRGVAHIVGFSQLLLDSSDPVGNGFLPVSTRGAEKKSELHIR